MPTIIKECHKHGLCPHYTRSDGGFRCSDCAKDHVTNNRRKAKEKLVELHGGKCSRCGYDKCVQALQFHHRDRKTKAFGIGSGNCKSWAKNLAEASKCDLLCANCHIEIENGVVMPLWRSQESSSPCHGEVTGSNPVRGAVSG